MLSADRATRLDGAKASDPRNKADRWAAISRATDINPSRLRQGYSALRPALDALIRANRNGAAFKAPRRSAAPPSGDDSNVGGAIKPARKVSAPDIVPQAATEIGGVLSPEASFAQALQFEMARHGDTPATLHRAVVRAGEDFDRTTLGQWKRGTREPATVQSLEIVRRIEQRYQLKADELASRLGHRSRAAKGQKLPGVTQSELRRLAWHLPADFARRPAAERAEILQWVRDTVISGTTAYRRYQAAAAKQRFGLRFANLNIGQIGRSPAHSRVTELDAPAELASEMKALLSFKTSTLTPLGYGRSGVWGSETAAQKVEHLSLLFGALAASSSGDVNGLDAPRDSLCFALLVLPATWDWYLRWRHARRGFYTAWETDMLMVAQSLVRKDVGWLRQSPRLAERLAPIEGLITEADIQTVKADWAAACDRMFDYARATLKEVQRISRVHRDPFEPILGVLEADSPLGEYRKIADEIEG